MNIIRKFAVAAGLRFLNAGVGGGITLSLTDERMGRLISGGDTATGIAVNEDSAMRITAAFACVRVISETIGAVTLDVMERQPNGNAEKANDHDLAGILVERPNADMTGMVLRETLGTNLAGRGNAYALVERNRTGNVSSVYPVPTARVQPRRDSSTDWERRYRVLDRGKWETFPADKIWHVKGHGWNGLEGMSPIGVCREAFALSLAGEEFNARLFRNGLHPSMILKPQVGLKTEQLAAAQKRIEELHAGLVNTGKPYMLPPGTEVQEGIFTPQDAQFLQLRKFQIAEIARIWRIAPHMIADLERATNNNIEQMSLEFAMYTMLPYYRRFEEEAQQLLRPQDRKRFFVRFNYESLLRADSQARAQLYSILLQNGVYSRNEVRALERRNTVAADGMDDYTVQQNMALISMLKDLLGGEAKKTEAGNRAVLDAVHALRSSGDAGAEFAQQLVAGLTAQTAKADERTAALVKALLETRAVVNVRPADVNVAGTTVNVSPPTVNAPVTVNEAAVTVNTAPVEVNQAPVNVTVKDGPRRAVFDEHGNPIGSVPVDSIEAIKG